MRKTVYFSCAVVLSLIATWLLVFIFWGDNRRRSPFIPLKNGFGCIYVESSIDQAATAELYYKDLAEEVSRIWIDPIDMNEVLIHDDMILLLGYQLNKDNFIPLKSKRGLFVARVPAQAINIANNVLETVKQPDNTQLSMDYIKAHGHFAKVCEVDDKIVLEYLVFADGSPIITSVLSWDQIKAILDKKEKGAMTH